MSGQVVLITGASDGIGAAAVRQLVAAGDEVAVIGRSPAKTAAVAQPLNAPFFTADFAELAQVRKLAAALTRSYPRIDVLVNNAGGIMAARELTKDGFEKTFQINHLAPFLLTSLLMPTLIASNAKVLQTSSAAARAFGLLDVTDLQSARDYSAHRAYGNAKLANILFTKELHRRYHAQGLSSAAFHPGVVATNFASESTVWFRLLYRTPLKHGMTSPDKGASRLVWLAQGTPGTDWQSGEYYERNRPAQSALQATNDALAEELWDRSQALLDG